MRLLACVIITVATQAAVRPAAAQTGSALAIEHANVLTMSDAILLVDHTVLIEGGLIRALGPSGALAVPDGARRVDATGRYLIPGLVDGHVHLLDENDLPLLLTYGVTTVLNMSGNPMLLDWRERIRGGTLLGPVLYTTGPQIKPMPHPLVDFVVGLDDPSDGAGIVAEQVESGYDMVKVWGDHQYDALAVVLQAADSLGIPTTGHLSDQVGLVDAINLRQRSVAHIEEFVNEFFNRRLDEARIPELAAEAQRGDLAVFTTLATYDMITRAASASNDEEFTNRQGFELLDAVRQLAWRSPYNGYRSDSYRSRRACYRDALAFQQRIAAALSDAGVLLIAGSDAGLLPGLVPGLEIHRELELLVDGGLSPFEALQTATSNPGNYLGRLDRERGLGASARAETPVSFGRITVGSRADLLLLERNPLDDIRATRDITSAITRGRLLGTATLETMTAEIRDRNVRTAEFVDRATADVASAVAYADSSRSATGEPGFELAPAVLLGIFTFEGGARGDAIALLELAARNYPSSYFPEYLLGQMRLLSNDREGAQRSFSRVLELVPGYPAARRRLVAARSNLEPDRPSPPGGRR